MDTLGLIEQQAIDAAIASNWEQAIAFNKQIIAQDKNNLGAYLRLGFAQLQNNMLEDAGKAYRKALRLQPKHQLAVENLERIEILLKQKTGADKKKEKKNLDPTIFLDMPGKTKTVQLSNLGQKQHLADLYIGEEMDMKNKKRKLEVRTMDGDYIGCLPDDISKRLSFFLENDSIYQTFIKEASLSRVLIFIKEVSKGDAVKGYISFPASNQPMMHPLQEHENDGEDSSDDDDKDEDDVDWTDEITSNREDEDDKHDLLHIHTESDDDDSEE